MAPLPKPIGIDATLVDIAAGIGEAARLLPTLSRSEIGAVAVKTAKVRIEFEMARASARTGSDVELGLRTFGVGASQSRTASTSTSRNIGSIELEIVAIADADPPPPPKPVKPVKPKPVVEGPALDTPTPTPSPVAPVPDSPDPRRVALDRALAMLKMPQATAGLTARVKRLVATAVGKVEAAVRAGDLDKAAELLAAIPALLPANHFLNRPER
ncbi:hypothetical protein [Sandarakinorhabdus sp.]|uniref:hypothetical protein n=1 Tax=Sandarakinorhabdus sp. TaxID=1916663 RepID=UPI003F728787